MVQRQRVARRQPGPQPLAAAAHAHARQLQPRGRRACGEGHR